MKSKTIIISLLIFSCLILLGELCFSFIISDKSKNLVKNNASLTEKKIHMSFEKISKFLNKNQSKVILTDNNVIGNWQSEDDENWKLNFSINGTCTDTYVGSYSDSCSYVITNTSPQCGVSVSTNQYTAYLRLTNLSDTNKVECYLLNGTTDSTLSLSPLKKGGVLMFKKIL